MKLSATMKETLAKAASQFIAHNCESKGAYGRTIWPSYGVNTRTLLALESRGLLARVEEDIEHSMVITPAGVAVVADEIRERLADEDEDAQWLLGSEYPGFVAMGERKFGGVAKIRALWSL